MKCNDWFSGNVGIVTSVAVVLMLHGNPDCLASETKLPRDPADRPNIVLILTDDQGYEDIGVYGARGFETPYLDEMAADGIRFTNFYVASSVCSASRAALLTGAYPKRVGLPGVILPWGEKIGISDDEKLLSEILKERGYVTTLIGKWHLGDHEPFMPWNHGFDEFYGTPSSNDLGPRRSTREERRLGKAGVQFYEGREVIEVNPDQRLLTRRYTERAVDYIERNREEPFFLYLAHNMPHTPLFVSEKFAGTTERGLYGDVIAELDWSTGQVLQALKDQGLDENTIVIYTSDNGPWTLFGDHGGSAFPLRGAKKQTFDGGQRVPCIVRWSGQIPSGLVCDEIATAMDFVPTLAALVGGELSDNVIDGKDIWPLLTGGPGATSPHEAFFFYSHQGALHAVRKGQWKLQVEHTEAHAPVPRFGGQRGTERPVDHCLALYNLVDNPEETRNLAHEHPEIVLELKKLINQMREELGDTATGEIGRSVREPGRIQ